MIEILLNNIHLDLLKVKDKELLGLIIGRPGGKNTVRIIDEILMKPKNANQLSKILDLDYTTVTYHLNIMCSHDYATKETFENYSSYYPSEKLIKSLDEYMIIKEFLENEK